MSLLVRFEVCDHRQMLMEVGEIPVVREDIPTALYPLDAGETIDPGNAMTCITCDTTRIVRTAV
jgi:hypothetical protein